MLVTSKVKMSGSEIKSEQEHIQHFPQVLRYSRAKQRQRNVQKIVLHVHAKLFFFFAYKTYWVFWVVFVAVTA